MYEKMTKQENRLKRTYRSFRSRMVKRTLSISFTVDQSIKHISKMSGRSINDIINDALYEYFARSDCQINNQSLYYLPRGRRSSTFDYERDGIFNPAIIELAISVFEDVKAKKEIEKNA